MKQRLWLSVITCLAHYIDKELHKVIDYSREQVRVLMEHQEKEHKRILLTNSLLTSIELYKAYNEPKKAKEWRAKLEQIEDFEE